MKAEKSLLQPPHRPHPAPLREAPVRERVVGFERFTLDLDAPELRLDGEPVPLRRCALRLLTYLVEHAGRPVSRRELFEEVWAGVVVVEGTLTQTIWELRQVLEQGSEHSLIRTLRGRGYCFSGAVCRAHAPAPGESQRVPAGTAARAHSRALQPRAARPDVGEHGSDRGAAYDELIAVIQCLGLAELQREVRLAHPADLAST